MCVFLSYVRAEIIPSATQFFPPKSVKTWIYLRGKLNFICRTPLHPPQTWPPPPRVNTFPMRSSVVGFAGSLFCYDFGVTLRMKSADFWGRTRRIHSELSLYARHGVYDDERLHAFISSSSAAVFGGVRSHFGTIWLVVPSSMASAAIDIRSAQLVKANTNARAHRGALKKTRARERRPNLMRLMCVCTCFF